MKDLITKALSFVASMLKDSKPGETGGSIGRVAFGLLFALCCIYWMHAKVDPPSTMTTTLWSLLGYVTSTKVVDLIKSKSE
jgi:hypothetical protein